MRIRALVLPILLAVFLWLPGAAVSAPYLVGEFPDNYLHPRDAEPDQRTLDIIGDSNFDLLAYRVWGDKSVSGWIRIDILTGAAASPDFRPTDAALGDLLLDTRLSGDFDLAVALRSHGQLPFFTGMGAEDAILQQGDVFTPASYRASGAYYGSGTWYFGDGEVVTAFGGTAGKADVLFDGAGGIAVVFQKDGLDPENLRLRLAWTCANDVMDATSRVPEPASLLLLGLGMSGIVLVRRFRIQERSFPIARRR